MALRQIPQIKFAAVPKPWGPSLPSANGPRINPRRNRSLARKSKSCQAIRPGCGPGSCFVHRSCISSLCRVCSNASENSNVTGNFTSSRHSRSWRFPSGRAPLLRCDHHLSFDFLCCFQALVSDAAVIREPPHFMLPLHCAVGLYPRSCALTHTHAHVHAHTHAHAHGHSCRHATGPSFFDCRARGKDITRYAAASMPDTLARTPPRALQ